MNFQCEITNELNADVVVIGGGTAGVFAAIAAARSGAKTILIEKNTILGGTMIGAGVNYPGLFFAWGKQIISGPCWESIERTVSLGGAVIPKITYKPERHWHEQIRVNKFIYTHVLFDMCREAGIDVLCNSMISYVSETENGVKLVVTGKGGLASVVAKAVIDATGDADATRMAGYEVCKSETLQPSTLENHITGYDIDAVSEEEIASAFPKADLPGYLTPLHIVNMLRNHSIGVHVACDNADNSRGKTELEIKAYSAVMSIYRFMRGIKGLENLEVDYVAHETGVRETNRILGESTVTADDYISGKHYADSVCYAFYPIDRHVMGGIEQVFHKPDVVSEIPYSALTPRGSKHIICAGRCISADTYANSAIRVEATCMATGQAAGCAAALAAKNDIKVSDVCCTELWAALRNIGAIVPE